MSTMSLLDLNQTVLRVAINNVFPFCYYKILDNNEIIPEPSIEINYLKLMMERFHFQVKFIDMKFYFGSKINGTWDGVVGKVNRSEVDLGMCDLSITWNRFKAVDYTHYTLVEDTSILTFAPEPKPHPWIVIVPFTGMVWTCIILSILTLSAIHYYNHRSSSAVNIVLKHLAIILRQHIQCNSRYSNTLKTLFLMWMLLGLILSTSYVIVFFSTLTVLEYDALKSSDDLLYAFANDRVIARIKGGSHFSNLIETTTENESALFYEIKQNVQRNQIAYLENGADLLKDVLQWKRKTHPGYFSSKYFLTSLVTIMQGRCKLSIVEQSILFTNIAFALPKGSQYLQHFSKIIQFINEAGLSEHWTLQTQKYFLKKFEKNPVTTLKEFFDADLPELLHKKPEPLDEDIRQLRLGDFRGLLYTVFGGIAISLIVFLLEVVYFLYNIYYLN